jgi:hypothetical protein
VWVEAPRKPSIHTLHSLHRTIFLLLLWLMACLLPFLLSLPGYVIVLFIVCFVIVVVIVVVVIVVVVIVVVVIVVSVYAY